MLHTWFMARRGRIEKDVRKLGGDLSRESVNQFAAWCAARKRLQGRTAQVALELIQRLSLELDAAVMLEDWEAVDRWFAEAVVLIQRQRYQIRQADQRDPPARPAVERETGS